MKHFCKKILVLIPVIACLTTQNTLGQPTREIQLQHFVFPGGNAAANMYRIYVQSADFTIGDEIAAFNGFVLCGAMAIQSNVDVWDNDLNIFSVLNNGPGYQVGNPIILKGWDAGENKEYDLEFIFTDPNGNAYMGDTYPTGDNKFSVATVFKSGFGVEENWGRLIQFYPIPADDEVTLDSPFNIENICLYSISGNKMKEFRIHHTQASINVSWLPPGFYVLHIQTEKGPLCRKLIIR